MKKIPLIFLLLLASGAAAQRPAPDTFVHLTSSFWLTLDPANAFDAVSFILVGNVYESLITFESVDNIDSFKPFLSTQVPTVKNGLLSADLKTYIFPIRQGVPFQDGSFLTAEDVRYSLLRFILMDSEGGPAALLLKPILGVYSIRDAQGKLQVDFKQAAAAIEAKDDKVIVHLKAPDSAFLKILASLPIITSQKWAQQHGDWDGSEATWRKMLGRDPREAYFNDHMNGTGPFMLSRVDKENHQLILLRNEHYWRKAAALKKVIFKVVSDGGLRLFMLETGDADSGYLEYSYRRYMGRIKGIHLIEKPAGRDMGEMLFFTFKIDPANNEFIGSGKLDGNGIPPDFFSDINIRRGFAYAFDYEKYLKSALEGRGQRVVGPIPPEFLRSNAKPLYTHDPAKAAVAFKQAFNGALWNEGFVLTMPYTPDDATRQTFAEVLKSSLEKINPKFKIRLYPMPNQEFYRNLESRKLPIYVAGYYADYPDPQSFAFGLMDSGGYYPRYQGYANAEADALVESAVMLPDAAQRNKAYLRLKEIADQDIPQIYTFSPKGFRVCRDWVEGCDSHDDVNDLNFNGFPYFYSFSIKAR